jgi:glycosyltransferase involved in cell wall biosynthesis
MTPLVTAILPVHDRARWVARAVGSVLAQTYPSIEILVVDDGSTDGTREVLAGFGTRIDVLAQPRAGAYAARNAALARARGDLVAFIDSDDAWRPDRLARQVPLFERPGVGLVFGDAAHVTGSPPAPIATGRTCFGVTPPARGEVTAHFAWGNFVPTSTVLARRRVFDETGPFSLLDPLSADYRKWYQVARRWAFEYVDGPVADYTVHAEGMSHDLERSIRARIRHFSEELELSPDPGDRRTLRRLIFHLSLHLAWAALRGRTERGSGAWQLAGRTAAGAADYRAPTWAAAFVYHHARSRRRVLAAP